MLRHDVPIRSGLDKIARDHGFHFHIIDDEIYWDESRAYRFTLQQIEERIEKPTAELHQMCLDVVDRAVKSEELMTQLAIPPLYWDAIAESWQSQDPSLYGRMDFVWTNEGSVKLLEYNADTPTSIFEAAVFQWTWLEQAIERAIIPKTADQYNSIHEHLIDAWKKVGRGRPLHLTGLTESNEDYGTLAYLEDAATQAGLATTIIDIADIGWREGAGCVVDLDNRNVELAFKLYPWEWMFHDAFGAKLADAPTRWIEPPWKAVLSNKGILPLLWEMFPGHPNLLPAFFEDDPRAKELGTSYVRKPLYSREGANVTLVSAGVPFASHEGRYGSEGFVRQALAPLRDFDGQYPVIGSWLVDHTPCGLSVREDAGPITGNNSRFLPHAIL